MLRGVGVEMARGAGRANMVDMFTDKKEQRVSSSYRQQHCPPRRGPETFRQNRKDCYPEKRSSRETDQCAKLLMRQLQRCTNPSPGNGESISCNDLPESGDHLGAGGSPRRVMIVAAKVRLDGNVNQFVITAEQCSIGITALRFVRHDRNHGRDRKSTRLNSSHRLTSRMPSSA